MANILIFGGLGYIGSALCELYRNETQHNVTVVDNRFIPERIAGSHPISASSMQRSRILS